MMAEVGIESAKIDVLKPSLRNVNLTLKLVNIGAPRSVTSRRDVSVHRIAEVLVGVETGCAVLNLWDDQIGAFADGDVIEVRNGYTSLFRGFLRLNIGKQGSAEKVDKDIGEVNTENNLSKERHESFQYRPARRVFRRRRRY